MKQTNKGIYFILLAIFLTLIQMTDPSSVLDFSLTIAALISLTVSTRYVSKKDK